MSYCMIESSGHVPFMRLKGVALQPEPRMLPIDTQQTTSAATPRRALDFTKPVSSSSSPLFPLNRPLAEGLPSPPACPA